MIDIVERLRFDAARCGMHISLGIARNIEEAADEIERLREEIAELKGSIEVCSGSCSTREHRAQRANQRHSDDR
jgi:hypothetical protein